MNLPSDQTETSNNQSKSATRSEIWKDFYENSTLHGLRNAFASERRYMRVIWLVLLLGGTGYLIFSIVKSFNRFFQYPSMIQVNEDTKSRIPFPAITICPLNVWDNYKIHAKDGDPFFDGYKLNISACAATADVRGGAPCGYSLMCAFVGHPAIEQMPNCTYEYQKAISQALNKANITFDKMEFLRTFSESWNEILEVCLFSSVAMDCSNPGYYTRSEDPQYERLCYTFNDVTVKDLPPIESEKAGRMDAVSFLLKHRPERYFYPLWTEGYDVFIHNQNTGLGETEISASPGKRTSIAIQKNRVILLEKSEGGQCEQRTLKGLKKYTKIDCQLECYSDASKASCGCRPMQLREFNDSVTCYKAQDICIRNLTEKFNYKDCPCPLSCDETSYKTFVSYAPLARSSIPGVKQIYPFPSYSSEKYAAISVYFSSHRDITYRQQLTFGPTSLFGEIGGNMGLLLGCSLMTVVEFIVLLGSLITSFFKPKGQVRDTAVQTHQAWN